jgi:hypothetical protein
VRVRVSVLDVDDEPPRFTRNWYRFEVAENMSSGAEVGRVEAFDEDLPPFNSFFYQLETSSMSDADDNGEMAGDSDDDDNYDDNNDDDDDVSGSYFAIDPTTGIIFTRRSLDRESLSHFAIRIRAQSDVAAATPTAAAASGHSSSSSFSDAAVVFIRVTDVNDNAPEVTYPTASDNTVNVPRASEVRVGDVVATVSARDRDSGANARLTYSIVGGNDERRFEIGQTTGTVRWRRDFLSNADPVEDRTLGLSNDTTFSLIRSSSSSCPWTLKILVQDSGTPTRLSTTTQLNVVVDDLAQCRGSSVSAIVVNPPPDGASLRRSEPAPLDPSTAAAGSADRDRRHHQSALTATGQPLFGGLTDWHVFVILVALAACVIVVGGLLTAAVVLRRGCSSSGRSRRRSGSTSANVAASELDCCPAGKGDGGDVELKLLTSLNGMGPMADLATLSKAGGTLKGFGTATVVGRSVDGEPVLLVLDAEKLNGRVVLTVGEQQQLLEPHLSPNSVSRLRHPSYIEV